MERNISSYVLKITSGAELSAPLDDEKTLVINSAELTIYDISDKNNDDGTYTRSYKARITSEIELEQENKPIRGKDRSSQSVRLRRAIWAIGNMEGEHDDEQFYTSFTNFILLNLDKIYILYKKGN